MVTVPTHCGYHVRCRRSASARSPIPFTLPEPEPYSAGYLTRVWQGWVALWGRLSWAEPGSLRPAQVGELPAWAGARPSGSQPPAPKSGVRAAIETRVKTAPGSQATLPVETLRQRRRDSCGQTCVAMVVNALTGKHMNDDDVNRRHGYRLVSALNQECRAWGYRFRDAGDFGPGSWARIEACLRQRIPVIIGLNGPFSPSGRGHVVAIVGLEQDRVRYADPATGTVRTTTRDVIERAPGHPQGKFLLCGQRSH